MAGFSGRDFTFDWDSTTLTGVRSRSLTINNEHVDVTNDDSSGWRELLADPGVRSIDVTIGGIVTDEAVLADVMAAAISGATLAATLPTALAMAGSLSGTYFVSGFTTNADHDGSCEFEYTFMSSGAVTYTASSA